MLFLSPIFRCWRWQQRGVWRRGVCDTSGGGGGRWGRLMSLRWWWRSAAGATAAAARSWCRGWRRDAAQQRRLAALRLLGSRTHRGGSRRRATRTPADSDAITATAILTSVLAIATATGSLAVTLMTRRTRSARRGRCCWRYSFHIT